VIEAETCHLVTLNKISILNTSCALTSESLLLICIHIHVFAWYHYSKVTCTAQVPCLSRLRSTVSRNWKNSGR
jgi:hypothetical protein